jgi:hypothetical protein
MGLAHERLRLIFPRSDLSLAEQTYNLGKQVIFDRDWIRFDVEECRLGPACSISYEFDRKFHLHQAIVADSFRSDHRLFYLNGKDDHPFSADEAAQFLKVRCLSGCSGAYVPVDSK